MARIKTPILSGCQLSILLQNEWGLYIYDGTIIHVVYNAAVHIFTSFIDLNTLITVLYPLYPYYQFTNGYKKLVTTNSKREFPRGCGRTQKTLYPLYIPFRRLDGPLSQACDRTIPPCACVTADTDPRFFDWERMFHEVFHEGGLDRIQRIQTSLMLCCAAPRPSMRTPRKGVFEFYRALSSASMMSRSFAFCRSTITALVLNSVPFSPSNSANAWRDENTYKKS